MKGPGASSERDSKHVACHSVLEREDTARIVVDGTHPVAEHGPDRVPSVDVESSGSAEAAGRTTASMYTEKQQHVEAKRLWYLHDAVVAREPVTPASSINKPVSALPAEGSAPSSRAHAASSWLPAGPWPVPARSDIAAGSHRAVQPTDAMLLRHSSVSASALVAGQARAVTGKARELRQLGQARLVPIGTWRAPGEQPWPASARNGGPVQSSAYTSACPAGIAAVRSATPLMPK